MVSVVIVSRAQKLTLATLVLGACVILSGLRPYDRPTWLMEVAS